MQGPAERNMVRAALPSSLTYTRGASRLFRWFYYLGGCGFTTYATNGQTKVNLGQCGSLIVISTCNRVYYTAFCSRGGGRFKSRGVLL